MERPVVVIGSGIVGSAIAFELQNRGATTILIERDIEPQGASAFSFASLSAFDEPLRDVYLLKSLGMVGWRAWSKRLGEDLGVRWDGEIRWAETTESATHLRELMDRAASRGYPIRSISPEDLSRRLPGSTPKGVLAASLASDDGQADPLCAIDVLRGAFAELGGTILVGRASLLFDKSSVQVRIGDEQIEASSVVVAAGVETGALLERFGWEIPMEPSPGLLALTEPTEPLHDRDGLRVAAVGPSHPPAPAP